MSETRLISIMEAAAKGIDRIRMPKWSDPSDHIKIDIIDGRPGPWAHLYSTMNRAFNGRDPVDRLMLEGLDTADYEPYAGPLPGGDAYCAKTDAFEEAMKKAEGAGAIFGRD